MPHPIPAECELTQGIPELSTSKEVPLWLAFAAQNFLDIHHIFRQDVGKPFQVLQETGRQVKQTIEKNWEFHQSLQIVGWPPENDVGLRMLVRYIDEWSQEDLIAKWMNIAIRKHRGPPSFDVPCEIHLLRRHSFLSGLSCFSIQMNMQAASIPFVNASGSVIYLYNAVRQEDLCKCVWPEMEQLLEFHTPERFFADKAPTHPSAYMKQFQICTGAGAVNTGRRSRDAAALSFKPRGLDPTFPVLEIFKLRYCDVGRMFDLDEASGEKILSARTIVFENSEEAEPGDEGPARKKLGASNKSSEAGRRKSGNECKKNKKV